MASNKLWRRFILGTSKGIKIIADFKSTIDNIHLFRWNALHVLPDTSIHIQFTKSTAQHIHNST